MFLLRYLGNDKYLLDIFLIWVDMHMHEVNPVTEDVLVIIEYIQIGRAHV